MKKFMIKLIILLIICSIFIAIYCNIATIATKKYNGSSTAEQISMSFKNSISDNYNCYFLGNSRIYRDINPDIFYTVNAYNFGHDNDSYNQMYYKLLYLLDNNKKIDYLIIGTDYFQFSFLSDTRNYAYSKLFSEDYSVDFGETSWLDRQESYYTSLWTNKQNALLSCVYLFFQKDVPKNINYQKENGQYIVYGNANPDDTIDRDYTILDIQYKYFKWIIDLCETKGIELYVIMPPLWKGETLSHTDKERKQFDDMILNELKDTPYNNHYVNYSAENGLLPYTDFIDVTHLTPEAADRYSEFLNNKIFIEKE